MPMASTSSRSPSTSGSMAACYADSPADFAATFDGAMWMTTKPIDVRRFNRNPFACGPHFVVPGITTTWTR